MGTHENIGWDKFPRQGSFLGRRCRVNFGYSDHPDGKPRYGKIVRHDIDSPYLTLIQLEEDGRVVRAEECQYSPIPLDDPASITPEYMATFNDGYHGVCLDGRWKGWMFKKHPDGYWVSVTKLPLDNAFHQHPFAKLGGIPVKEGT